MKIKNRNVKKTIALMKQRMSEVIEKIKWYYIALIVIIVCGIGLLIASYWIADSDLKNIVVGLGTGIITSALVTLYIDIINTTIETKKLAKYKIMLLHPLYNAVKMLYVQAVLRINEYRIREKKEGLFFFPMENTKKFSDFLNEMKEIDIESIDDEKRKKRLDEFSSISIVYFREVISQYEGLPFESLILDNIITQEEYNNLKRFALLNESKKCLDILNDKTISEKERYRIGVQLLHCMMLFINRLMEIFDFVALKIETENRWIKEHLDDIYYYEIYVFSDEYIERYLERAEAEAEYYAEHPELVEGVEESEEDQLCRRIDTAIWSGDIETIKKCFPKIDRNNKQIQSVLTWSVAKDVMKDKELRELYYQKYGIKYKVRKEKRKRK